MKMVSNRLAFVSKASEEVIDEFIDPESYELEVSSPALIESS